ncbi:MAG TPA: POTRA domain-containing protein, partial [Pseudorhodoferax sp.]|nr:POTRA domain-containing protein [Pseudorhodoferax sp.]
IKYTVTSVRLEGEFLGKEEEFRSLVSVKPGEPYKAEDVASTTKAFTVLDSISALPKMVSSERGKLEARRQRTAACACTAGATPAASTPARPAFLITERRSMETIPEESTNKNPFPL